MTFHDILHGINNQNRNVHISKTSFLLRDLQLK
jgi:hypothetical protein